MIERHEGVGVQVVEDLPDSVSLILSPHRSKVPAMHVCNRAVRDPETATVVS